MYIPQDELLAPLPPLLPGNTPAEWRRRRQEILDLVVDLEYGGMPPQPETLTVEQLHMAGRAGLATYKVHIDRAFSFTLQLYMPAAEWKRPVVLTGDGCYKKCSGEVIAEANRRGFIVAKFNRTEFAHDMYNTRREGGIYDLYPGRTFGAIAAWAWGYSRALDALERIDCADTSRVGITGHSRGGKTVLLAGAADERFAFVNPNNSGCGGAGCYRYHTRFDEVPTGKDAKSETLADILRSVPYWFGPRLQDYVDREAALPFDQHFLKACVAPRVLVQTESLGDTWSNPAGSYLTYKAAREVWALLGVPEKILYRACDGGHDHRPSDFRVLFDVMEGGDGMLPGYVSER